MSTELIKVDGLAVECSGPSDGLPVLFGHSLLMNRAMFAAQVADLSRDFRCLNVDFRGHGDSDIPKSGFSITDQAEDYKKVLDHLGLERAAIVGLSMGGMAGMHFAVAHPGRVAGLVLMNTSADVEPPAAKAKEMALAVVMRLFGVRDFLLAQVAPLMFGERFLAESPAVVEASFAPLSKLDRTGLYRAVRMVLSRPPVGPRLAEVRVPTLVIAGDQDLAAPAHMNQRIAETIPGAEYRLLPRTGHLSTIEEPEITTKLMRIFLERLSA